MSLVQVWSVLEHARRWAEHSGQPVTDFLTSTIELSLLPLGQSPPPMTEWDNEDILSASESQLPIEDDCRLSGLLDRQREGCLSESEAAELRPSRNRELVRHWTFGLSDTLTRIILFPLACPRPLTFVAAGSYLMLVVYPLLSDDRLGGCGVGTESRDREGRSLGGADVPSAKLRAVRVRELESPLKGLTSRSRKREVIS